MDAQVEPKSKSVPKRISFSFKKSKLLIVYVLFMNYMGYIMSNSGNQLKLTCAASVCVLYLVLLLLKEKVLQLDIERPLEALKWRRLCICVVYAVSSVFEVIAFAEDMDKISRSFLHVGSSLMLLVPLALHCTFGEFEAVMDSLPGTGKEVKGKQTRRVITHIMSFTPMCGFFLLPSGDNPWKLAFCGLSYLLASLMAFSEEKVNEWKLESLVLVKKWRRTFNSSLLSFWILNLVVIYHTQHALYIRNALCKTMCGLILITVVEHVYGVEMENELYFKRKKEKGSDNGEDTGESGSIRITDDEWEGNFMETILFLLLCTSGVLAVGLP